MCLQEAEAREAQEAEQRQQAAARKEVERAASNRKQQQQQAAAAWRPAVGELVDVPKLGTSARVEHVKGKKVTVGFGQMSMTVNVAEVLQIT